MSRTRAVPRRRTGEYFLMTVGWRVDGLLRRWVEGTKRVEDPSRRKRDVSVMWNRRKPSTRRHPWRHAVSSPRTSSIYGDVGSPVAVGPVTRGILYIYIKKRNYYNIDGRHSYIRIEYYPRGGINWKFVPEIRNSIRIFNRAAEPVILFYYTKLTIQKKKNPLLLFAIIIKKKKTNYILRRKIMKGSIT